MLSLALPLLHTNESPPFTESVVLSPSHIERFPLITGVGLPFIVTIAFVEAVHPALLLATTVYVPPDVTDMLAFVEPLLHEYDVPPFAARVTVSPSQAVRLPVICGVGFDAATTLAETLAVQPLALVAVTLYVPAAETFIICEVALLLHA